MTKEEMQALSEMFDQKLADNLKPINDRLDKIEKGQAELKQGLVKLEIKIENEIERNIQKVAEGHSIINRKLDKQIELGIRVETLEHKVSAIEYAMGKAE